MKLIDEIFYMIREGGLLDYPILYHFFKGFPVALQNHINLGKLKELYTEATQGKLWEKNLKEMKNIFFRRCKENIPDKGAARIYIYENKNSKIFITVTENPDSHIWHERILISAKAEGYVPDIAEMLGFLYIPEEEANE